MIFVMDAKIITTIPHLKLSAIIGPGLIKLISETGCNWNRLHPRFSIVCFWEPPLKRRQMIAVFLKANGLDLVDGVGCRVKLWLQKPSASRLWKRCGPGLSWRRALQHSGSHWALAEPLLEANLPPWHTNCWSFTVPFKQSPLTLSTRGQCKPFPVFIKHACFYWVWVLDTWNTLNIKSCLLFKHGWILNPSSQHVCYLCCSGESVSASWLTVSVRCVRSSERLTSANRVDAEDTWLSAEDAPQRPRWRILSSLGGSLGTWVALKSDSHWLEIWLETRPQRLQTGQSLFWA